MSQHIRAVDASRGQSAEQLVATCGAIIKGLTDNPAYPSPPIDLKTLQSAVDDLNAALAPQAHGGKAATAEKKNKQADLISMMRKLKHYVEDNCKNDPAVLFSSGFQAAQYTRSRAQLDNPSILDIDTGNSGELVLKITKTIVKIIEAIVKGTETLVSGPKTIVFVSNTNLFAFNTMLIAAKTKVFVVKTIGFLAITY